MLGVIGIAFSLSLFSIQQVAERGTRRKSHYPWTKNGGQVTMPPQSTVGILSL